MKISLLLVIPALFAGHLANAQSVQIGADCAPQMSQLETRLYEKAKAGPDTLRDFIFSRRGVYGLDYVETATWASDVDAARSACEKRAAAAGATFGFAAPATSAPR